MKKWIENEELNIQNFRERVCLTLFQNDCEDIRNFLIPEDEDSTNVNGDLWIENMMKNGAWCDEPFIRLASKYIKRDIIVYTIPKENGHNNDGQIIYSTDESLGRIYLLNYVNTHYQSIIPLDEIDIKFSRSSAGKRFGFDKRF